MNQRQAEIESQRFLQKIMKRSTQNQTSNQEKVSRVRKETVKNMSNFSCSMVTHVQWHQMVDHLFRYYY
jgi:hypothetical protein